MLKEYMRMHQRQEKFLFFSGSLVPTTARDRNLENMNSFLSAFRDKEGVTCESLVLLLGDVDGRLTLSPPTSVCVFLRFQMR